MAGIPIFATGGIGGVHRDGENSMDISADLIELGRSPIAVVSSGVKSILDIPKTLEFLETQGVFVGTYQCPEYDFPAFYTRKSGVKVAYNFLNTKEVAELIQKSIMLELNSGILIAVPVPQEFAMNGKKTFKNLYIFIFIKYLNFSTEQKINKAIENALADANCKGVKGKEVTPFILSAVAKITSGKSLETSKLPERHFHTFLNLVKNYFLFIFY